MQPSLHPLSYAVTTLSPYWVCGAAGRCIPVRATTAGTGVDGIEALLITSSGGKGLVFPKVSYLVNVPFSVDTCWWSSRLQPASSGRCWRSHWLK